MFPLIFNGSQLMSEAPRNGTQHDMADRKSGTDAEALADELVEKVGYEEAIRLIKARKPKNKRGRSDYVTMDIGLIWLAGSLQEEWRRRLGRSPHGRRLPTRRALATKIVDLFWDDLGYGERLGLRTSLSLRECLKDFGARKKTVVQRLLDRPEVHWDVALQPVDEFLDELKRDGPEEVKADALQHNGRRLDASLVLAHLPFPFGLYVSLLHRYEAREEEQAKGSVGLFEALHRQRPDLRLLPEKTFG
jgi:hypothetical protein